MNCLHLFAIPMVDQGFHGLLIAFVLILQRLDTKHRFLIDRQVENVHIVLEPEGWNLILSDLLDGSEKLVDVIFGNCDQ